MSKQLFIKGRHYYSKTTAENHGLVFLKMLEKKHHDNSLGVPGSGADRDLCIEFDIQSGGITILRECEGVWNAYRNDSAVSGFKDLPMLP